MPFYKIFINSFVHDYNFSDSNDGYFSYLNNRIPSEWEQNLEMHKWLAYIVKRRNRVITNASSMPNIISPDR
jgi:hypothetical protein